MLSLIKKIARYSKTVCQLKTDQSHLCFLLDTLWLFIRHHLNSIIHILAQERKWIKNCLFLWGEKSDAFLGIPLTIELGGHCTISPSVGLVLKFTKEFCPFSKLYKTWARKLPKMLSSFCKSVFTWENKSENTSL